MKIWYCISILFCLYSINILNEEYDISIYKLINQEELFDYLFCFNLKEEIEILANKTTIDLDELNRIVYDHFNELEYQYEEFEKPRYWKIKNEELQKYKKLVLNPIKAKNFLILSGLLCLIRKKYNEDNFDFIQSFFKTKQFFVFQEITYDLLKLTSYADKIDQLVVMNEDNSNCIENYSKLKCLNQCFKQNRLSKYIYNGNESGIIHLNYEYNQTIKEKEHDCHENRCVKNGCKLVHFESIKFYEKSKTTIFKSTSLISKFDFYIQFTGLVCLIGNTCFYQLLSMLFEYVKPTIKKIKKIKIGKKVLKITNHEKYLHAIKIIILLICVGYFAKYYFEKFEDINTQLNDPVRTESKTYQLESEPINLVICIRFENILKGDYKNLKFSELEKATDRSFNDTIKRIYLKLISEKIGIEFTLTPKILFNYDSRCFQIEMHPNEPKYQSILSTSKLVIKSRKNLLLYLLAGKACISTKIQNLNGKSFWKKILKRSKSKKNQKCIDYEKEYSVCCSKQNCIDRCVNLKFMEDYNSITIQSIVDKQHFSEDQWSNLLPNDDFKKYNKTKEECRKKFLNNDCYKIRFEHNLGTIEKFTKNKSIDLYYEVVNQIEEEPSFYKLLIDILNIESILFGQNVLKSLLMIYCLLNSKYQLRNSKYYLYFIYLICLFGFICHTFFIFNQILNEELIQYVYYTIERSIKMPEIIFCFNLNRTIDKNFRLTVNYLNELTNSLRKETIFKNITYLSKSNEWISLDSNFENSEFKIETFYLLDKKCFKLSLAIEYYRKKFHLLNNRKVLKVYFNFKTKLDAYFFY